MSRVLEAHHFARELDGPVPCPTIGDGMFLAERISSRWSHGIDAVFLTTTVAALACVQHFDTFVNAVRSRQSRSSLCRITCMSSGNCLAAMMDSQFGWGSSRQFTRRFLADGGTEGSRSDSRARRRERGVWQRRFREHLCRDEDDLSEKVDYIHWIPVKHGLVWHVADYRWSSFRRFVKLGHDPEEWGGADEARRFDHWEWE